MVKKLTKDGAIILSELTAKDVHDWHMATGVSGEAGELLDAVKKVVVYRKPVDLENVVEELGDLEYYMEGLRQGLGITREQTLEANIAKLSVRYEGLEYSDESAQKRADKNGDGDYLKEIEDNTSEQMGTLISSLEDKLAFEAFNTILTKVGISPISEEDFIESQKVGFVYIDPIKIEVEEEYGEPIKLTDTVVDTITGFKGVVVAVCEYVDEPTVFRVQSKCGSDVSKAPEAQWLNEHRLEKYND